jgi:poly(glycerol-phosphate) alpha-glucosyltransferase
MRALGLTAPICIIPNGINLPAESREEPPPWAGKIESNSKILLFLGRIHPKKGLANLLKAWRKVGGAGNAKANGWVLAIAGWSEGGHEAELKCLAAELEIPFADVTQSIRTAENSGIKAIGCSVSVPQVSLVFLGPQFFKAKKACLTSCDGFVLPSFGEGLPMSVLEAWSYGKPVLMTPDCNIPEGFEAQAALKVRADVDSIATGLREFFSLDDCGRQVLGDRGRLLVLGKFAWSNIAIQMKQVYDWMLGGGSLPGCFING